MLKFASLIDKFPKTWKGAVITTWIIIVLSIGTGVATSPAIQVSMARLIDMRDP